ncbi:MAG: DinB family protein [Agarilytica sp.]
MTMNIDAVRSIIIGNIEALDQGIHLVNALSDAQYRFTDSSYTQSSIGQHFRHIIDMYMVVSYPDDSSIIDYDTRRRGADVETCCDTAIRELNVIKTYISAYLNNLDESIALLDQDVDIKTEVTIDETHSVVLRSNKLRELVFTSSHAVHHFALISMIAKIQGIVLDKNIGVAPATATFLRSEAEEVREMRVEGESEITEALSEQ